LKADIVLSLQKKIMGSHELLGWELEQNCRRGRLCLPPALS